MNWPRLIGLVSLIFVMPNGTYLQCQVRVPSELTHRWARDLLRKNSPEYLAERLAVEEAEGFLATVSTRPNPELTLSSAGLGFSGDDSFVDNQEFTATVSYVIERRGKRSKRMDMASHDLAISESNLDDWARNADFELKKRYYNVVLAQWDLQFANENAEAFGRVVGLTRVQYERGEISGRELRRMEAEQYRFQEDVIAAEVELENAQDRLLAILGSEDFNQSFRAVDDFDPSFAPPPAQQLKSMSFRQRKDLLAQRQRLEKASAGITLEEARGAPDVTLFGGYRRDFGHDGAVVGVSVPLPLFNRNRGGIARAHVGQRQARLRLQALEIRVSEEVQLALNNLGAAKRRIDTLFTGYLDKSRQARDISETAYRLGSASFLEFLDAQRAFREASHLYTRGLYEFELSRARLEWAVGGML